MKHFLFHKIMVLNLLAVFLPLWGNAQPNWSVNPAEFQFSMNVTGQLQLQNVPNQAANNMIGVFAGEELRGVATPTIIGNQAYYFLTLYSNNYQGDTLRLRAYIGSQASIYLSGTVILFNHGLSLGKIASPHTLNVIPTNIPQIYSNAQVTFTENTCYELHDVESLDNASSEGNGLTYSIVGGMDAVKFNIHPGNGKLSWAGNFSPDFENPADANGDNKYQVRVKVTDPQNGSSQQTIVVQVINNSYEVFTTTLVPGTSVLCPGLTTTFSASGGVQYLWNTDATTAGLTGIPAGTYTVTVTNEFACTTVLSGTISLNSVSGGTIAASQILCPGFDDPAPFTQTGAATASGVLTYRWEKSSSNCDSGFGVISGAAGATYDVPAGLASTSHYHRVAVSNLNGKVCESPSNCMTVSVLTGGGAPIAVCKNASVQIAANGQAILAAALIDNGSASICGNAVSLSVSPGTFSCAQTGIPQTATLTVTDLGNNQTATCTAQVQISDLIPPVVACKPATIYLNAAGTATVGTAQVFQSGSDNCGTVNQQSVSPNTFVCLDASIQQVTLTVNDGHGNTAECTATVTVTDTLRPVLFCHNATVNLDTAGAGTVFLFDIFQGFTDNCNVFAGGHPFPNDFSCNDLGAHQVTSTIHDNFANEGSCTVTVTVVDATPPSVVCKNATVNLNAAGTGNIAMADVFQSGADNCGTVNLVSVVPGSFNCSHLGANSVLLTVNDGHGNQKNCTATVTVVDNIVPTVVCKNASVSLNAAGTGSIAAGDVFQSGADNCGAINPVSVLPNAFSCSTLGANTVTLSVNDGHGNNASCTATVTVTDAVIPSMFCNNVTLALSGVGTAALTVAQVNNGSFDNCSISTMSLSQTSFNCTNVGPNAVTLAGFDPSGNKGQCTATVTVTDGIAPVAFCKNITVQLNAAGTVTVAPASVNNGSGDNCNFSLALTPGTFNCANVGTNTVTLKATDTGGNTATCTAIVTVQDVTAPTAGCKNPTVYLNALGVVTITPSDVNNGSSDACGITSMTINSNSFNCSNTGSPAFVTLTVKDAKNNTATCQSQVTVKDNLAPTAACENVTVQLNAQGKATVYSATLAAGSFDNCAVWSYTPVSKLYTTANMGVNNLSITVKDFANNAAICVSQVTVQPYNSAQNLTSNHSGGNGLFTGELSIQVFPNPAEKEVQVAFRLPQDQPVLLRLFDVAGRLVWSRKTDGVAGENDLQVSVQDLPIGLYLIDIQSDMLREQKRLAVQR